MTSRPAAATMMLLHKTGAPAVLLPEFLQEVYVGQRTGLLHITHDEGTAVSFRSVNGEIVSGSSTAERGRLGESMVRRGVISREDLKRALAVVAQRGRRLAPVLREMELLDTPRLEQALAFHIREMLLTALRWKTSALLFEDQELPEAPAEDLTLRCPTADLILELVRQIPAPEVRLALGDLDRALGPGDGSTVRVHRRAFGSAERYLLSRADRRAPARAVIESAQLPTEEVERSLLGLLCTGVLHYASAAPSAAVRAAAPPKGSPAH
jgi:hypothetical protein